MVPSDLWTPVDVFLRDLAQSSRQIMWLLGAGASRSAGMPTANDVIWDLKRRLFCLRESEDLRQHDLHNTGVRSRIQQYFDSLDFPPSGSPTEYGAYLAESFGEDYSAQQRYLSDMLSPEKITLSIGHRAMAALLGSGHVRLVFTTNFDSVIEQAYAQVVGDNLAPFHLEGSYAALDALNAERFPIYTKLHGDYRYRSIKNMPSDLLDNERELEKCFLAAANRYGLVVVGYSGRDECVLRMLKEALARGNAYPHGVYWTTVKMSGASEASRSFIAEAREAGVDAYLVETGPFDDLMTRLWRVIEDRPTEYEERVRAVARPARIPLPDKGSSYPILRTNALPVLSVPEYCGAIETATTLTHSDLTHLLRERHPRGVFVHTDAVLFWGSIDSAKDLLAETDVQSVSRRRLEEPEEMLTRSGLMKSFFDRAVALALAWGKPLLVRRRAGSFHLAIMPSAADAEVFHPVSAALADRRRQAVGLAGVVPKHADAQWAEALSVRLSVLHGRLWLMVEPSIWIEPQTMREEAKTFLRERRSRRYNSQSYELLSAWITVLIGEVGSGDVVEVTSFPDSDFPARFGVSTRTAYSRRNRADV